MLLFLASIVEQLDLALEHIEKGDVHNARIGLMLTDNAVELVLHQFAKDKQSELKFYRWRGEPYAHQAALDKALRNMFNEKLKFARIEAKIPPDIASTFRIMHEFRNDLYHAGLMHEQIITTLSRFYFDSACEWIATYNPTFFGWSSNMKIPARAAKYFGTQYSPGSGSNFLHACTSMRAQCNHSAEETIMVLACNMERIINEQDSCIDVISEGVYVGQQRTRDRAVIECQSWPLAFSPEGEQFASERGWTGSKGALFEYLSDHYAFRFGGDPIPAWRKQVAKLAAGKNAHAALAHYSSFMLETAEIRDAFEQSAAAAEAEAEAAMDRMRGD